MNWQRAIIEYIGQVRGFRPDVRLFLLYNLLTVIGFGVFQVIFNLYLTGLNLREDDIGAFSAGQTLAMAAGAAALGRLHGRYGIWRCIVGGVVVYLLSSYLLAFAEHPSVLLVLSAINGLGLAFIFTSTMPFIMDWARRDQRQHVAAVAFSLISLASTIGALFGGLVPGLLPGGGVGAFRWTLVAGTAIGTLGLIPLFKMGPARAGRAPVDLTAPKEAEGQAERRQVRRDMGIFIAIGGLMSLGAGMVVPFYNVYLTTLGADARQVGYVFALAGLLAAVIGLSAPAVARRFGSLWSVVGLRLLIVPVFALLIVVPSVWLAVLGWVVRQTTISMSWPIDSTFIAEVLPPRARSHVFGLRSAAWNVGFSAASLLAGWLIVRTGYGITFFSLILFTLISMALFAGYYSRHPRVRAGEIPTALPRAARLRLEHAASAREAAASSQALTTASPVGQD